MNQNINKQLISLYSDIISSITQESLLKINAIENVDTYRSRINNQINEQNIQLSNLIRLNEDFRQKLERELKKDVMDSKATYYKEVDDLRYFCEGLINCKFNDLKSYIDDCLK